MTVRDKTRKTMCVEDCVGDTMFAVGLYSGKRGQRSFMVLETTPRGALLTLEDAKALCAWMRRRIREVEKAGETT